MVWLIIFAFIVWLLLALLVFALSEGTYKPVWHLAWIVLLPMLWALCLFSYNRALAYETKKCAQWSIETGYETKYRNVGYGDWNCYGKTDGKWLPIERIRGIED